MSFVQFCGPRLAFFTLLVLNVAAAQAAPPAAPAVTSAADIKQLQFDWQIAPRSNYYELWFKADVDRLRGTSDALTPYWPCLDQWRSAYGRNVAVSRDGAFIAVSDPADKCVATGSRRFNSGTGPQASGAVYIHQHHSSGSWPYRRMLKTNNSLVGNENFSGALAFAENGRTFAVAQVGDNSAATGINGDRTDNSKAAAGAVWLY